MKAKHNFFMVIVVLVVFIKVAKTYATKGLLRQVDNHLLIDTSVFNIFSRPSPNIYEFDNNNTLTVLSKGVKITAKDDGQDSYSFLLKIKGKIILSKKGIKGVSKVFIDKEYLSLSTFSYADEDGNNEGTAYLVDLRTGQLHVLGKKLKNTCNPVIINNKTFYVDGLKIIQADAEGHIENTIKIRFNATKSKKSLRYLDEYAICSLSNLNNIKLLINFTPDKLMKCRAYSGVISDSTKVMLLK